MIALIIEDEPSIMSLWRKFLEPVACEIRQADNLAEAFILMRRIPPPDLVLLDLRLPDSVEARETLARVPEFRALNPKSVIVVITGASEASLPMLAREVGVDGFFDKGGVIGQTKLLESIKESCEHDTTEERLSIIQRLSAFMTNSAA